MENFTTGGPVDDEAIVEWSLNFKEIQILVQECKIDEIINGEDRDFFYNDLLAEDTEFSNIKEARFDTKKCIQNEFPDFENNNYEIEHFPSFEKFGLKKDAVISKITKKRSKIDDLISSKLMNLDFFTNDESFEVEKPVW